MKALIVVLGVCLAACSKKEQGAAPMSPPAARSEPATTASTSDASRAEEAELMLDRLMRNAKAAYVVDASYPTLVAPLTPAAPCCEHPGKRCQPDESQWATAQWQAIDFATIDEPFDYQYGYTGVATGTSFEAVAIGDPGCIGKPIKVVLRGTVVDGAPVTTMTRE